MRNTESQPFQYTDSQAKPASAPETGQGPTVDDAATNHTHSDVLRAIQCVGVWLNRQCYSDQLTVTLEVMIAKLDQVLERLADQRARGQLMSIKVAAEYLALSERTIRERIALRQWPAYRSGNAVRVDVLELKELMAKECR